MPSNLFSSSTSTTFAWGVVYIWLLPAIERLLLSVRDPTAPSADPVLIHAGVCWVWDREYSVVSMEQITHTDRKESMGWDEKLIIDSTESDAEQIRLLSGTPLAIQTSSASDSMVVSALVRVWLGSAKILYSVWMLIVTTMARHANGQGWLWSTDIKEHLLKTLSGRLLLRPTAIS